MTITDAPEASPEVTPLDRVIQSYLSRIDAGEPISRDDLLMQHFELREELQEFFDDNDLMQQLAGTQSALIDTSVSGHLNTVMINTAAPLHTSRAPTSGGFAGPFPVTFGQYRILRALGEGAMGLVYLAEDVKLGRKVALKVPQPSVVAQPENLARFRREAQASAGLRHHNICRVYEVNEINGTHYIAMAFIEGKPLSDVMRKDPQWSATQIADTVCRIARALDVAHRAGIIHRDLKPANIIIDPDGDPIVMDFGLACYVHAEDQVPLTLDGAVLGTPSYMSPEQIRKELGKVGPASDIYALGVIMYELLTGQRPFSGPMLMLLLDVVNEHKSPQKPSEIRPGCHPQLEVICLKMLSKSLTDRHRSMKEVAADLTDFLKAGQHTNPSAATTIEPQTSPMTVGSMFSIRPPWTRLSFMFGGFAALVFCGWIIIKITSKDGKETIITAKEGTQIDLQTEPGDKVSITRKADAATDAIPITPEILKYDWPTDAPKPAIAPFSATQALAYQEAWAKHLGVPVEHVNSIGMKFILIPPGEFMMGSTPTELEAALKNVTDWYWLACINSEAPQHKVILTQPIYLGVHEVTQGDYERVMRANPSAFSPAGEEHARVAGIDTTKHPVESVTWLDAAEFCGKLSQQEKLKPFYVREAETITLLEGDGYRLPQRSGMGVCLPSGNDDKVLGRRQG